MAKRDQPYAMNVFTHTNFRVGVLAGLKAAVNPYIREHSRLNHEACIDGLER